MPTKTRRRLSVRNLRAAWWTLGAVRRTKGQLRRGGLEAVDVAPPPGLPADAEAGMMAVLRRREDTCLVRAVVRQAWHRAHGVERDVVIGVTAPGAADGFAAHAWLEGDHPSQAEGFSELTRF
jgi:hypothetical protein